MTPEFSRSEPVATVGEQARTVEIAADEAERSALSARFGLIAIGRLAARFDLQREGTRITAQGRVEGDATQACTATGAPLPVRIDEQVALRFAEEEASGDEVEIDADAIDTLPIENGSIDLGEAAAETLALALDPYLRAPDAGDALAAAGVLREDEVRPANPFAALARLRGK